MVRLSLLVALLSLSALSLNGCAAVAVADAAVGTTVFVAKTAVKGTYAAGKLAVKGVGAGVNAVTGGNESSPQGLPPQDQASTPW